MAIPSFLLGMARLRGRRASGTRRSPDLEEFPVSSFKCEAEESADCGLRGNRAKQSQLGPYRGTEAMRSVQTKPICFGQAGKTVAKAGDLDAVARRQGQPRQTKPIRGGPPYKQTQSGGELSRQTKPICRSGRPAFRRVTQHWARQTKPIPTGRLYKQTQSGGELLRQNKANLHGGYPSVLLFYHSSPDPAVQTKPISGRVAGKEVDRDGSLCLARAVSGA